MKVRRAKRAFFHVSDSLFFCKTIDILKKIKDSARAARRIFWALDPLRERKLANPY